MTYAEQQPESFTHIGVGIYTLEHEPMRGALTVFRQGARGHLEKVEVIGGDGLALIVADFNRLAAEGAAAQDAYIADIVTRARLHHAATGGGQS
ncbi:hypothetical protein [Parvibaculum sp. MBR-TMA-1.3b-4.2]|jgi:surface antigen